MEIETVDGKKVLVEVFPSDIQQGSVSISEDVQVIGEYAFKGCIGLTQVTLPNKLTHIRAFAFDGCTGLTQVTLPNSLTHIGAFAFGGCTGLTQVTLPNSLPHIGACAFDGCTGLTQVTLPNSLTHIGAFAFSGCTGLTHVIIDTNDANEFVRLKNLLPEHLIVHATPMSIKALQKSIVAQFNKACFKEMLGEIFRTPQINFLDANIMENITSNTPEVAQLKKGLEAIRPIPGLPHQQQEMDAYGLLLQLEMAKHTTRFKLKHTAERLQQYVNIMAAQQVKARVARSTSSASSSSCASSAQAAPQNLKTTVLTYTTLQKLILQLQQGNIPILSDEEKQALQKPFLLNLMSPIIKQLGLATLPKTPFAALFNTQKQTRAQQEGAHTLSSSAAPETASDLSDPAAKKQTVPKRKRPFGPTLFNTEPNETSALREGTHISSSNVAPEAANDLNDSAAKRRKVSIN